MSPKSPEISGGSIGEEFESTPEVEKEGEKVEIYLGRHPDKPIRAKVSPEEIAEYKEKISKTEKEMSDEAVYHKLRHDKGGAPISPEDKIGSLSLEGIYEAQKYAKNILWEVAKQAPDNSIIIDFTTSEMERTKESAYIMYRELEANAKKEGKKIQVLGIKEAQELYGREWDIDYLINLGKSIQPWLENPPGEEKAPDPDKVAKEVNKWIKKVVDFTTTLPKGKKYIAVGISHGGILDAYLKKETGKLPSELGGDIKENEFMKITKDKRKELKLNYRNKSYNLE